LSLHDVNDDAHEFKSTAAHVKTKLLEADGPTFTDVMVTGDAGIEVA
jgi:hypothetical protein